MTLDQRNSLFTVLLISTALVILNIYAVSSGLADSYYASIKEWFEAWLQ